jgi:hypothetical protein
LTDFVGARGGVDVAEGGGATEPDVVGIACGAACVGSGESGAPQEDNIKISANAMLARQWSLFIILSPGRRMKLKL